MKTLRGAVDVVSASVAAGRRTLRRAVMIIATLVVLPILVPAVILLKVAEAALPNPAQRELRPVKRQMARLGVFAGGHGSAGVDASYTATFFMRSSDDLVDRLVQVGANAGFDLVVDPLLSGVPQSEGEGPRTCLEAKRDDGQELDILVRPSPPAAGNTPPSRPPFWVRQDHARPGESTVSVKLLLTAGWRRPGGVWARSKAALLLPVRFLGFMGRLGAGTLAALVAGTFWFVTLVRATGPNQARRELRPLERKVTRLPAWPAGDSGDAGGGLDNTVPWHTAYYYARTSDDLLDRLIDLAADEGYDLRRPEGPPREALADWGSIFTASRADGRHLTLVVRAGPHLPEGARPRRRKVELADAAPPGKTLISLQLTLPDRSANAQP